jgi:hypothetical protein
VVISETSWVPKLIPSKAILSGGRCWSHSIPALGTRSGSSVLPYRREEGTRVVLEVVLEELRSDLGVGSSEVEITFHYMMILIHSLTHAYL